MRPKLFSLALLFLCVACERVPTTVRNPVNSNSPVASPTPYRIHDAEVDIGYMYWTEPIPILGKEWQLVVGGTVEETHQDKGYGAHPQMFTSGTLNVEKVFLNFPTKHDVVSASVRKLKSDVFDDLSVGDKVIVFVSEYDGGYGIIEVADSNCKMGIKVKGWNDPIVGAVERMIGNGETVNNMNARRVMLQNATYAALWKPYSSKGIAYLLRREAY